LKETKDGKGEYLQLQCKVLRGPYQNSILFDQLNLKNENNQTVEIAKRTLSAICHAVGVMVPKDSSELHDKPLTVTVAVGEYNGRVTNNIKGYSKYSKEPLPAAPTVTAPAKTSPFAG